MAAFAVILAAYISATTMHELGHALTCIFLRLPIERFAVWPFSLGREGNSWRLAIWPRSWIAGTGGFVRFQRAWSKWQRVRLLAVYLAGPVASALAAYLCLSIRDRFAESTYLSNFVNMLGIVALLQVANILPLKRRSGSASDGWRIWELLRSWRQLGDHEVLQSFSPQLTERRPRDWDPDLVYRVIQTSVPELERYRNWIKYRWFADTGKLMEARAALDWGLANGDQGDAYSIAWECLWFEAFTARDLAAAQQRFAIAETSRPVSANPLYKYRALAALAALEGRSEDAISATEKARECLAKTVDPNSPMAAVFESELAESLSRLHQSHVQEK